MRQSSMRSQRSKGFKAKNVLQMFVLAAICIWLLYQLKHSYDKKRVMEERNAKIPDRIVESHADIFKLGRKDLPNVGDMGIARETHHKEDENEEAEEEEHETKHEAEFDERNGLLDDQFDEEPGHGEESSEEDKDALIDDTDLVDEEEHEGNLQEAREEHYKKDDASSAVHHDPQTTESEFRNEGARSLDEEKMTNETVIDSKMSDTETKTEAAEGGNGTSVENSQPLTNSTTAEHRNQRDRNQRELQDNNSTISIESNTSAALNNRGEIQSNSSEVDTVITSVPMQNETVKLDSVQDQNSTTNMEAMVVRLAEKSNTSEGGDAGQGGLVVLAGTEKSNTSEGGGAAQGLIDSIQIEKSNTSESQGMVDSNHMEKSNTSEGRDAVQGGLVDSIQTEKSNASGNNFVAEGESNDPLQMGKPNASEQVDLVREEVDDQSHNTVTAEEKEARVDLSTLPDIEVTGTNTDYEAAE